MTNSVKDAAIAPSDDVSVPVRPKSRRDAVAVALLVLGALLPWNVHVGVGIAGTAGWVLAVLVVVTLLALAAVAVTYAGPDSVRETGRETEELKRRRLLLTVPMLAMVVGFVGFTVVQSIRYGGTGTVPPGIGPGAWLGAAGAILAAQPVAVTDHQQPWDKARRIIGTVALVLAVAAALFNVYWRTRFVAPNIADADTGTQNLVVFIGAVLYAVVALAPVVVTVRWMWSSEVTARLAVMALGGSVLLAGLFVWVTPVGRDIDAFHGIAQNTSTAGVGFEGYLPWAVVAAMVATVTIRDALAGDWGRSVVGAARKCLLLIAVWCAGSAVLRIVDLMSASVLDLPAPPYNSTALMAFDLLAALLAMWLFLNSVNTVAPKLLVTALFAVLVAVTLSRVILGIVLVPRVQPLNADDINDVYGNTLSQQITSTFDVALCILATVMLVALLLRGAVSRQTNKPAAPKPAAPPTDVVETHANENRPAIRIERPKTTQQDTDSLREHVANVLAESTQRFGAGTTYTGPANDATKDR